MFTMQRQFKIVKMEDRKMEERNGNTGEMRK